MIGAGPGTLHKIAPTPVPPRTLCLEPRRGVPEPPRNAVTRASQNPARICRLRRRGASPKTPSAPPRARRPRNLLGTALRFPAILLQTYLRAGPPQSRSGQKLESFGKKRARSRNCLVSQRDAGELASCLCLGIANLAPHGSKVEESSTSFCLQVNVRPSCCQNQPAAVGLLESDTCAAIRFLPWPGPKRGTEPLSSGLKRLNNFSKKRGPLFELRTASAPWPGTAILQAKGAPPTLAKEGRRLAHEHNRTIIAAVMIAIVADHR